MQIQQLKPIKYRHPKRLKPITVGHYELKYFGFSEKAFGYNEIIAQYTYYQLYYKGKKVRNFFIKKIKGGKWNIHITENEAFLNNDRNRCDECYLCNEDSSRTLKALIDYTVDLVIDDGYIDNGIERLKTCPDTYRKMVLEYIS